MLLSGCLLDVDAVPPFSVSNLKTATEISSCFTNEIVSYSFIQPFFTQDAWETLQARVQEKKENGIFSCNSCTQRDNGQYKMVECEGCLEWYYYHCVGMRTTSKPNKWFVHNVGCDYF